METLYKYFRIPRKGSKSWGWLVESIMENKLYMGHYSEMNDPMEALYDGSQLTQDCITDIRNSKPNLRMCCMSKTYSDILMWSHYADSHRGICFEVEVEDANTADIRKEIRYIRQLRSPKGRFAQEKCIDIMGYKLLPWQYEEEVRYIRLLEYGVKDKQYLSVEIKKIIFGCKMKENVRLRFQEFVNQFRPNITFEVIDRQELSCNYINKRILPLSIKSSNNYDKR